MNGHQEEPAKFIQGQGELFSDRKKTRPAELAEQPKSNVSRKKGTAQDNEQSDTLVEMEPRMHPILKGLGHAIFGHF